MCERGLGIAVEAKVLGEGDGQNDLRANVVNVNISFRVGFDNHLV